MAASLTVPAEPIRRHDRDRADRDRADRGPGQEVIAEMAWLLRDTRGSLLLDGSVLSAVTIGIAVEAAFSPSVLRFGVDPAAGLACAGLLGVLFLCWLRAAVVLLLASRPVLDQLNDQRWRAGAPVDPRVRWLPILPAEVNADPWTWARVNLLLGAARIRRERVHLADTWTFITAGCFLAWTLAVLLGA
jgi:hypothetical protein